MEGRADRDILKPVRETVERHKARPPAPTRCPHCGNMPADAVTVCKLCGKDYLAPVHPRATFGDAFAFLLLMVVFHGALFL